MIHVLIEPIARNDTHSMTMSGPRFKIWWFLVAVVCLAVILACLSPVEEVGSVGIILVVSIPVACAPSKRRLAIATLAVTLHPVMIPVYLYATWATAWCVLGYRPRLLLDDPKYMSLFVDVPFAMTYLSFVAWPISFVTAFFLTVDWSRPQPVHDPRLIIVPVVWLATIVVLMLDPLGVLGWYFD